LIALLRDQLSGGAAVGDVEAADGHPLPGGGVDERITETKQQVASALGGRDRVNQLVYQARGRGAEPAGATEEGPGRAPVKWSAQRPAADAVLLPVP